MLAMSLLPRSHKGRGQIGMFLMVKPEMGFRVEIGKQPFLREVSWDL